MSKPKSRLLLRLIIIAAVFLLGTVIAVAFISQQSLVLGQNNPLPHPQPQLNTPVTVVLQELDFVNHRLVVYIPELSVPPQKPPDLSEPPAPFTFVVPVPFLSKSTPQNTKQALKKILEEYFRIPIKEIKDPHNIIAQIPDSSPLVAQMMQSLEEAVRGLIQEGIRVQQEQLEDSPNPEAILLLSPECKYRASPLVYLAHRLSFEWQSFRRAIEACVERNPPTYQSTCVLRTINRFYATLGRLIEDYPAIRSKAKRRALLKTLWASMVQPLSTWRQKFQQAFQKEQGDKPDFYLTDSSDLIGYHQSTINFIRQVEYFRAQVIEEINQRAGDKPLTAQQHYQAWVLFNLLVEKQQQLEDCFQQFMLQAGMMPFRPQFQGQLRCTQITITSLLADLEHFNLLASTSPPDRRFSDNYRQLIQQMTQIFQQFLNEVKEARQQAEQQNINKNAN